MARTGVQKVLAAWNWKSALTSSVWRASVFFSTNLPAGLGAALAASRTEFLYRAVAAGFYGALTARLARCHNPRVGTATALVVLPLLAHSLEYLVHRWAGTERLASSMVASVAVTVATTRFNLFAMRRGLLLVGPGRGSLGSDVRRLASLLTGAAARFARRLAPRGRHVPEQG